MHCISFHIEFEDHIFQIILAINLKLHILEAHSMEKSSALEAHSMEKSSAQEP